jgi:hypothetical protein
MVVTLFIGIYTVAMSVDAHITNTIRYVVLTKRLSITGRQLPAQPMVLHSHQENWTSANRLIWL